MTRVLIGFLLGVTLAQANAVVSDNAFVRQIEMRFGVAPGSTRVWPDCQCTVRYLGTSVSRRVYSPHFEKLD